MRRSDSIAELSAALSKFQAEVQTVGKDAKGNFGTYATLAAAVEAAAPVAAKHGISVSQWPEWDGDEDLLTTRLGHSSGEWEEASMRLHLVKDDPQGQGSATTYARRYAYLAALGLAPSDDDDGQRATDRVQAQPREVKQTSGAATEKQIGFMLSKLKSAGYTTAAAQLDYVIWAVKHEVPDVSSITKAEASRVIDSLVEPQKADFIDDEAPF